MNTSAFISDFGAKTAFVGGTGLHLDLEMRLKSAQTVPFSAIEGMAAPSTPTHEGRIELGLFQNTPLVQVRGRVHGYETGGTQAMFPIYDLLAQAGVERVIISGAVGSLNPALEPGTLVAVRDHIFFGGPSPLCGIAGAFVDMTQAYSPWPDPQTRVEPAPSSPVLSKASSHSPSEASSHSPSEVSSRSPSEVSSRSPSEVSSHSSSEVSSRSPSEASSRSPSEASFRSPSEASSHPSSKALSPFSFEASPSALPTAVYAWTHGPQLETPAEIQALKTMGADVVGMSMPPEVIMARYRNLQVWGLAAVVNWAAGVNGAAGQGAVMSMDAIFQNAEAAAKKLPPVLEPLLAKG